MKGGSARKTRYSSSQVKAGLRSGGRLRRVENGFMSFEMIPGLLLYIGDFL